VGIYLPCYDIFRNWFEEYTTKSAPTATPYVPLVASSWARSLACATCFLLECKVIMSCGPTLKLLILSFYCTYCDIELAD
ncbi:solute carrier family 25 member 39-like protein, partial [Trifolium pratense]